MMKPIDSALDRIKSLECPTGHVEIRVADILEDYKVAHRNDISIYKDEYHDKENMEAYNVKIKNNPDHDISIYVKSGQDDYVAKVVDVKII